MSIKLTVEGNDIFIVSYYNPVKLETKLFEILDQKCINYILLGDLNEHAEILGSSVQNQSGKILDDIFLNGRHVLLNDISLPTYIGWTLDKRSVLDLCICSSSMGSKVAEFVVLENNCLERSDHLPIQVVFSFSHVEKFHHINNSNSKVNFNYDKADWQAFKRELELKAVYVPLSVNVDILQ